MEDMIGRILVAFFAVVGLTELCRFVLFWLTRPGWEEKITVLGPACYSTPKTQLSDTVR